MENGMETLPAHLEGILNVTECGDTSMSGRIICECGCETFGIRYFGEVYRPECICISEYGGKYALVVKAICRTCGKEHLLFDFAKHDYEGLICGDGISVPDEELVDAIAGNEREFKIKMSIEYDDMEQFAEEVLGDPPDGMWFSSDDRVNIWSSVVIDLKCAKSGRKIKGFVDSELA